VKIGIDFDNTLVSYDDVFLRAAIERRLLPEHFTGDKTEIRDSIRLRVGDEQWAKLQAEVYGRRMAEATMIEGASDFVAACRDNNATVSVISHKTRFAAADPDSADLHDAAMLWMERNGFFRDDGLKLNRGEVFFEPTRDAKCRRIAALGCSHFVDDLEEVFREPSFPLGVERLLLYRGQNNLPRGPFTAFASWDAITNVVFPRGR
jgi:hypothetical protein